MLPRQYQQAYGVHGKYQEQPQYMFSPFNLYQPLLPPRHLMYGFNTLGINTPKIIRPAVQIIQNNIQTNNSNSVPHITMNHKLVYPIPLAQNHLSQISWQDQKDIQLGIDIQKKPYHSLGSSLDLNLINMKQFQDQSLSELNLNRYNSTQITMKDIDSPTFNPLLLDTKYSSMESQILGDLNLIPEQDLLCKKMENQETHHPEEIRNFDIYKQQENLYQQVIDQNLYQDNGEFIQQSSLLQQSNEEEKYVINQERRTFVKNQAASYSFRLGSYPKRFELIYKNLLRDIRKYFWKQFNQMTDFNTFRRRQRRQQYYLQCLREFIEKIVSPDLISKSQISLESIIFYLGSLIYPKDMMSNYTKNSPERKEITTIHDNLYKFSFKRLQKLLNVPAVVLLMIVYVTNRGLHRINKNSKFNQQAPLYQEALVKMIQLSPSGLQILERANIQLSDFQSTLQIE
ncbi:UNKNOWN [Stylonychia lemnae]|uniref:Transmembrane protein n=1 Tax=Stylonychia lemnae TaxID=5949 RepID=A0A078B6M9_STYLE|nr:UNKNOWN [Stylonychia lemnae]|eukprot:CDW90195.1 UNKNOWN [Stylonychia lemnae]